MKKLLVGVLAISGASMAMAADKPFTAEVLVGQSSQSVSSDTLTVKDADDTALAFRFGYEFIPSWSAEFAYYDFGSATSSHIDNFGDTITDTMTPTAFQLGVKKEFLINEKLSVNARAGMAFWDFDFKRDDSSGSENSFKVSDSSSDLYYGLGANYLIQKDLFVSLNYSFLSIGSELNISNTKAKADNDISTISLGIGYQF